MKKLIILLLVSVFSISLVACSSNNDSTSQSEATSSANSVESSVATSTEKSTVTSTQQEKPVSIEFVNNIKKYWVVGEQVNYNTLYGYLTLENNPTRKFVNAKDFVIDNGGLDVSKTGVYHHTVSYPGLSEKLEFDIQILSKPIENNGVVTVKVDPEFKGELASIDQSGASCFTDISTALSIIKGCNFAPTVIKNIYLAPATYKEKFNITAQETNVRLIGEDKTTTKISYDDCSDDAGGTDASSTIIVAGSGFMVKNVTIENGYDYLNGKDANKQAVAMTCSSDGAVFYNCNFLGYQDTLQPKSGRQYYKDCYIAGCTDFIFGNNATALFENCEIKVLKKSNDNYVITAHKGNNGTNGKDIPAYGYVFKNCKLTAEAGVPDGSTSLGRPWRADATVAYINCEMGAHISTKAFGNADGAISRYQSMSGGGLVNEPQNANFAEYGNTGAGAVSAQINNDFTLLANADNYTYQNIFAKVNGMVTYNTDFDAQAILTVFIG